MYHFRVKVIGRSSGRSAAGATAYRTGGRSSASGLAYRIGGVLSDPLTGQTYDYRGKGRLDRNGYGVLHAEVLAPPGAKPWVFDLQSLLNRVEAAERRKDAQLFRELEISLPRELSHEDHKAMVRKFAETHCVRDGMVAVIAHHNERAADGGANPHVHVLLTMRSLTAEGFGNKVRDWNSKDRLREWREAWAELANEYLKARGFERRLDHRSFKDRDIDLEPDVYVGPAKARTIDGIIIDQRKHDRAEVKARNFGRMLKSAEWVLDQISRMQATFTENDIAAFLYRHGGVGRDDERYGDLMSRIMASNQLMRIASDLKGPTRFTTRSMFECEVRLSKAAEALAGRGAKEGVVLDTTGLSPEQVRAARHVVSGPDLTAIEGIAGAGKTHLLAAVARALAARGYRVRGAALSKIVARSLGDSIGAPSQTVHALLKDLARDRPFAPLEKGDVLVLDEAGLVGSRQMEAILSHAERVGAKVVLVGDTRQLQAIEAGAAYRAIVQRHGAAKLSEVRRQNHEWQRGATRELAQGQVARALATYKARGSVHAYERPADAMQSLAQRWLNDRGAGGGSQIILAHRKRDAAKLNAVIREKLREAGELGDEFSVPVIVTRDEGGELEEYLEFRSFAAGDRILFTRNDQALGVENGTVATIKSINDVGVMRVVMPDGSIKHVDPSSYAYLEQGYAMTIHKAQGMTVDRTYVYASRGLDAHATYVAMTRHRERVDLYYDRAEFENEQELFGLLQRDRQKDSTLDYGRDTPSRAVVASLTPDGARTLADERLERARAILAAEREARAERGPERD